MTIPPWEPVRTPADLRPLANDAERKALASVLRLKILRMCLYEALTNREIATNLGNNPASTLHHVRTLVLNGFLVAEPARRGTRGAREVPYRATKKSWRLRYPDGDGRSMLMLRAFLDEIDGMASDDLQASRLGLALSPDRLREFNDRLRALLDEFAGREMDPEGKRFSVFLAIHPERWSAGDHQDGLDRKGG